VNERLPQRREWLGLVAIVAGLWWLLAGQGLAWFLWTLVPGLLLIGAGVALLLWPGDSKHTHYLALGALLGGLVSLPAIFAGGLGVAVLGLLVSALAYLAAGRCASRAADASEAPQPEPSAPLYAKIALDEALLGYFLLAARVPSGEAAARACAEATRAESLLRAQGWLERPESFHCTPEAPQSTSLSPARSLRREYQRLRFASGFIPQPGLPATERWSGALRNRDCHAWLLRQGQPGRPWLLCIHGYRMGVPLVDFRLFPPEQLYDRLGLNLLLPVLPLHGPRRRGWDSGEGYLDGDPLDLLHAQTQALWDLRRCVAWIRTLEPDARIGVLGYSLGGYNAALLAAYESSLDFVIAGIPVADFASLLWRHLPLAHRQYWTAHEFGEERLRELLRVVSPLARTPQLPAERRYVFAGSVDTVAPPAQALALAKHWGMPVRWYHGGHLSFRGEPAVDACLREAMVSAGWRLGASGQAG
jgi:hypothetical protein